jgi:hypothetical protein
MDVLIGAFTESIAHGIFTAELLLGVLVGLAFIIGYAKQPWWTTHGGRLSMSTIVAITVLAAGSFLFRLGWQGEALTLLIPTCAVILVVMVWWVVLGWKVRHTTTVERAQILADAIEALADTLADEGHIDESQVVRALAKNMSILKQDLEGGL